ILYLAQEPILTLLARARFHADEQPLALHPFPVEDEVEVALFDVFRALPLDRRPATTIPQHHRAAAIFPLRNHALELGISHRMILGTHGKALVVRVGARPPRYRPALEHAVGFE